MYTLSNNRNDIFCLFKNKPSKYYDNMLYYLLYRYYLLDTYLYFNDL